VKQHRLGVVVGCGTVSVPAARCCHASLGTELLLVGKVNGCGRFPTIKQLIFIPTGLILEAV